MSILSLKNQDQFNLVNKKGVKISGSHLILIVLKNFSSHIQESPSTNLYAGMKVSRKFSKKAVIRNLAKRRIRHLVRNLVANPDISSRDVAITIIPKKSFNNIGFAALSKDFQNCFLKAIKSDNR